jgi:hypothetical protein
MFLKIGLLCAAAALCLGSQGAPTTGGSFDSIRGRSPLLLGFQGGVGFADAQTPANISSSTQTGLMAGVNLEFRLNELISLQPEATFVRRGVSLGNSDGLKLTANSDSIEVPVLVRVNFGTRFIPYLFAGPVGVFNISHNVNAQTGGTGLGSLNYNPRTFDLAADFGAGIQLEAFFLNLRYSVGILGADVSQANWSSRGFQLLAGFNLGV